MEDNSKMDHENVKREAVDWIRVTYDRIHWQELLTTRAIYLCTLQPEELEQLQYLERKQICGLTDVVHVSSYSEPSLVVSEPCQRQSCSLLCIDTLITKNFDK